MGVNINDNEFTELFEKLKALHHYYYTWEASRANKSPDDEFGGKIKGGEIYYKRRCGSGFTDNFKLSRKNMELHFQMLFYMNPIIDQLAEAALREEARQLMVAEE